MRFASPALRGFTRAALWSAITTILGIAPIWLPLFPTLAAPLPQGEGAPDATLERHNVVLTEYAFEPSEVVAAAGLIPLRIVNGGIRRHTMVVLIDGVEVASPEVRPGDTVDWDITIERPGRYLYWCGEYRHLEKGMAGTLIAP